MKPGTLFTLALAISCLSPAAHAADYCTLIIDHKTTDIITEEGNCSVRHGAESTFKIPLALMGFDSGILKNAHDPVWNYKEEYNSARKGERAATDPERWEKESVVWFSQKLTRTLGMEKFKNYVEEFRYGNMDISGDKGKNNGLTNSWLSSSLKISPREQVAFLRKLLKGEFSVSPHAYTMTKTVIPHFSTDGWVVHGKTGSGFQRNEDGTLNRDLQRGWFVGWAEKDNRTIIFAKFIGDDRKMKGYAGPRARDSLLKELPALIDRHDHNQH